MCPALSPGEASPPASLCPRGKGCSLPVPALMRHLEHLASLLRSPLPPPGAQGWQRCLTSASSVQVCDRKGGRWAKLTDISVSPRTEAKNPRARRPRARGTHMQDQCAPRDPVHRLVEQGCGETKGERRLTARLAHPPSLQGWRWGQPQPPHSLGTPPPLRSVTRLNPMHWKVGNMAVSLQFVTSVPGPGLIRTRAHVAESAASIRRPPC